MWNHRARESSNLLENAKLFSKVIVELFLFLPEPFAVCELTQTEFGKSLRPKANLRALLTLRF